MEFQDEEFFYHASNRSPQFAATVPNYSTQFSVELSEFNPTLESS